jgi:hypothetical protein
LLTISNSFQPADDVPTTTNAVAPSGESQGDKGKANVETSEASMPTKPKKKKKVKSKSKPSESQTKEGESPIPTVPVENQPPPAVDEQPITDVQVKYLLRLLRLCDMNRSSLYLLRLDSFLSLNRVVMKRTPLHLLTMRKIRPKTLAPIASRSI